MRYSTVCIIRVILPSIWIVLCCCRAALAHPLPVDQLNRFTFVRVAPDRIIVEYSLLLTSQAYYLELNLMNADGNSTITETEEDLYYQKVADALSRQIEVTVDGKLHELRPLGTPIKFNDFDVVYRFVTNLTSTTDHDPRIAVRDRTYTGEPGPVKVVIEKYVPTADQEMLTVSDATQIHVNTFPTGPVTQQREASTLVHRDAAMTPVLTADGDKRSTTSNPATGSAVPVVVDQESEPSRTPRSTGRTGPKIPDELRRWFTEPTNGVGWLVMLGIAVVAGAAHALQPGHGKTMVAAYLVGTKGRPTDAIILGITVTAAHTWSVFALGLIVLWGSNYIHSNAVYHALEIISGLTIACLGGWLFFRRLGGLPDHTHGPGGHHHHHGHDHTNDHHHTHTHDHNHARDQSHHAGGAGSANVAMRTLIALGISGGIVPCWDAIAVLLFAVACGQVVLGLWMIVSFSLGLSAVLVAIGLLTVLAKSFMARWTGTGIVVRWLPIGSALFVAMLGALLVWQAMTRTGT